MATGIAQQALTRGSGPRRRSLNGLARREEIGSHLLDAGTVYNDPCILAAHGSIVQRSAQSFECDDGVRIETLPNQRHGQVARKKCTVVRQ